MILSIFDRRKSILFYNEIIQYEHPIGSKIDKMTFGEKNMKSSEIRNERFPNYQCHTFSINEKIKIEVP